MSHPLIEMTTAEPSTHEATRLIEPRVDDTLAHYAVTIVPTLPSSYPRQIGLACGEYTVRALLDAFDIEYEAESEPPRRVRWFGLSFVTDLRDALTRHGVDTDVRHASELHEESRLALLRGHIDSHEPVILAIGNGHLSRSRDSALARRLLGHYITIYGYDAERGVFFVYDPYLDGEPDEPLPVGNVERTAEEILRDWRGPIYYRWIGMDHVYLPVSPPPPGR